MKFSQLVKEIKKEAKKENEQSLNKKMTAHCSAVNIRLQDQLKTSK